MRDPYQVLGVSKNASAADIKSAFRKLAKKLHPDANKHDPKAASRFAELNAAYEILGEADKRKAFDRGEIDADGKPRFQGFEGFGGGRGRGGFGREGGFETFTWGSDGLHQGGGRAGAGSRGFGGFEELLKDEEGHINFLETQLRLLGDLGPERYGQLQAEATDKVEGGTPGGV